MWQVQLCHFVLCAFTVAILLVATNGKRSFTVDYENDQFLKDGKPFRYVSGSFHYYNVPVDLWRDRLQKMKYGGLNAVQTYIEWSTIETSPGVYDFSGNNNITRFFTEAQEEDLLVILRPSPFITSERDMGGLPSWLLKTNPNMIPRTKDPTYIAAIDRWFKVLLPLIRPFLYSNGGPIILVQLENEYGSYTPLCKTNGDYKAYLRDTFRKLLGNDIVLFTTDGNRDDMLQCGTIPEVFATIDFGTDQNVEQSFATLRRHQMNGPLVNSEFYTGWFDYWEEPHQTVKSEVVCSVLDKMLSLNASVNLYIYTGGTNYGFTAGAYYLPVNKPVFKSVPTSYDYDAPISEAGDLTPKFYAIKEVIKKYLPVIDSKVFPSENSKMQLPPVKLELKAAIFDLLPEAILENYPQSFEKLNHSYGFMLYSTNITFKPTDPAVLSIPGLHDRAQVFVDKEFVGSLSATRKTQQTALLAAKGSRLDILVENQGRICYGPKINQMKGIVSNVTVGDQLLQPWNHYRLYENWNKVLAQLRSMPSSTKSPFQSRIPAFYSNTFVLPNVPGYPLDSFLQVNGWTKGVAFLNGHNLGRYWPYVGPQVTLYAPSVFFKPYPQTNEIVLFELERSPCVVEDKCIIQFVSKPILNGTVPSQIDKPKSH